MSVKLGRNDPCWCGSGKKYKACHAAFDDKLARLAQEGHVVPTHDLIKTPDQIAGIKESAKINVAVLDYIEKNIHAGMNTAEIDKIVYDMTTSMGGIPAPLNYEGYPYSVCTSGMSRISFREGDLKRGGYYQCRLFYHSERIFFRFFPDVLHWGSKPGEKETGSGNERMCRTWT